MNAAATTGVPVRFWDRPTFFVDELENVFAIAGQDRAGALPVLVDAIIVRRRLVPLAIERRVPAVSMDPAFPRAGGLMSYGPHPTELYRRVATFMDRILKGAKPADLPVEQPTRYELVINLVTAKAIGLRIPQSMLLRADQVIE